LTQKGITCVGNGFNDPDLTYDGTHPITTEFHPYDSEGVIQDEYQGILAWGNKSFWNGKAWGDVEEEQVPI